MIQGKPWTNQEEDIVTEWWAFGLEGLGVENSFESLQTFLTDQGFNRSIEAIKRKIRRLDIQKHSSSIPISEKKVVETRHTSWLTGDIPLVKGNITKFVMLNDIHVPHNIDLTNIFHFIQDFKPDYVLLVGDIVNNDPFDHWKKAKPGTFKGMPQPKSYYELCNKEFYRPLRKICSNECKIIH